MRSKRWISVPLVAAIAASVYGGAQVLATPAAGFTSTTLAKATYGPIFTYMRSQLPAPWSARIRTRGLSDFYILQNTWDPAACGGCTPSSGWHSHPGPTFVVVTQGSVTEYAGDDPSCTPHVYTANTPNNAFVEPGGHHVHVVRDETGAPATTIAMRLVPSGAPSRVDEPDPGNCPGM
jgi:hypothetical protein